jgi:hypothetical protein
MLGTLNGGSESHCPAMEIFMQELNGCDAPDDPCPTPD